MNEKWRSCFVEYKSPLDFIFNTVLADSKNKISIVAIEYKIREFMTDRYTNNQQH
jgi:hypothetical protein